MVEYGDKLCRRVILDFLFQCCNDFVDALAAGFRLVQFEREDWVLFLKNGLFHKLTSFFLIQHQGLHINSGIKRCVVDGDQYMLAFAGYADIPARTAGKRGITGAQFGKIERLESQAEHVDDRLQPLLFFRPGLEVFGNRTIVPPVKLSFDAMRG
jgi:hypothetical protein